MRLPAFIENRPRVMATAGALLIVVAGLGTYLAVRPPPKPDYERDELDELFDYTLFQNEFNKLPVEERVRLVGSLVKRLEGMSGGDGTMLAAFAAGIRGAAREQLEENAARMIIDVWDLYAVDYPSSGDDEDRIAYIEQAVVDMTRLFEDFDGDATDKTDEELLQDAYDQAERDREAFTDPTKGPSPAGIARLIRFTDKRIATHATPHQRARIARYMRDMARHLRHQDLDTGEPLRKGGG